MWQLLDGLSLVHYVERLDAQGEALFAKFANSIWPASSHAGGFQLQGRLAAGVGQGEESELVAAKGVEVPRWMTNSYPAAYAKISRRLTDSDQAGQ